ncbi:DUF4249 domain-containing protein [Mucilaginibacter calamicampi]
MNMYNLKYSKNVKKGFGLVLALCVLLYACKEKYLPAVKDVNVNYLVVDGFINTGADSTIFSISRTFKLDNKATVAPEKGAIVNLESDGGLSFALLELPIKPGTYAIPALNLDQTKKYRLRIRTKDNRTYLSDFVESKISQPIDDVKYDFKNDNLNVYTNTHDASGKSVYYRYSYIETWDYQSVFRSYLKVENHQLKERDVNIPGDFIYYCWQNKPSNEIVLGATTSLNEDRLNDFRVINIPSVSAKVKSGYSVLIKQHVLTKEAFEFWENMKKNTEQVGSVFDAQPSQLRGNIHSVTDNSEIVIGFISAGTVTQKRLMLSYFQLPKEWKAPPVDKTECEGTNVTFMFGTSQYQSAILTPDKSAFIPVEYFYVDRVGIVGIVANSNFRCVDCRIQGGTNIKPSYWIE